MPSIKRTAISRRDFGLMTAAAPSIFLMSGCTSNQVITSLTLAIDSAEIALPIIAAGAGVPASTVAQLMLYLQATGQALAKASDILANGETPAQQAIDITAAFAGITLNTGVLTGLPQAIVDAMQKVAMRVSQFLATLPKAQAAAREVLAAGKPVFTARELAEIGKQHARALAFTGRVKNTPISGGGHND